MSEEGENPYCDWRCESCGNWGSYHYGTTNIQICVWNSWSEGTAERGCGKVLYDPHDPYAINARSAALTFYWCVVFGNNGMLKRLGKDLARQIAKEAWKTRQQRDKNSGEFAWAVGYGPSNGWKVPKALFRRPDGWLRTCGNCKSQVDVWRSTKRYPFGRIRCGTCNEIIRSVRSKDLDDRKKNRFIEQEAEFSDAERPEVWDETFPDGAE